MTVEDGAGGEALGAFIDGELAAERERRAQLSQRGGGIITTSTGLATLLFAAAALVTGAEKYAPPAVALVALAATFLAFAAAAFCGLMAARQRASEVVHYRQLETWRAQDRYWANNRDNVNRLLAKAKILSLTGLRAGNDANARWAQRGFVAQLVALSGLVVAVGAILADALI